MPVAEGYSAPVFRLLIVPGVTVDRWKRTWSERLPGVELALVPEEVHRAADMLLAGQADAGLVRLPIDQDICHAIPLYTEVTVVVVPRDHLLTAAEQVTVADLADETMLTPKDGVLDWASPVGPATVAADRPATTAAAVELVAAGAGVLVTTLSLARLYHRRDLAYRPVTDAPTSSVALAWRRDRYTPLVEEMIGIVRGRTANSTRGQGQATAASAEPPARATTKGGASVPTRASGRAGTRRDGPAPRAPGRRRGR